MVSMISLMGQSRITISNDHMNGMPCIRGLRVTVSAILGQLASGRSHDEILHDFPYLDSEDIIAALEFAAKITSGHELSLPA